MRAMEKCLLFELLQPWDRLKELQDTYQFSEKMIVTEQFKTMALDRGLGRVLRTSGRSCRRPAVGRG